jgi:hypothetical protein
MLDARILFMIKDNKINLKDMVTKWKELENF